MPNFLITFTRKLTVVAQGNSIEEVRVAVENTLYDNSIDEWNLPDWDADVYPAHRGWASETAEPDVVVHKDYLVHPDDIKPEEGETG